MENQHLKKAGRGESWPGGWAVVPVSAHTNKTQHPRLRLGLKHSNCLPLKSVIGERSSYHWDMVHQG